MNERATSKKGDIFIVDNSNTAWKVQKYLSEWCELSKKFDIATGFFEIGSLLTLDQKWQNLEKIRILMGDEVSKRTQQAFEEGLKHITGKLDNSIEQEKNENEEVRVEGCVCEVGADMLRHVKYHQGGN